VCICQTWLGGSCAKSCMVFSTHPCTSTPDQTHLPAIPYDTQMPSQVTFAAPSYTRFKHQHPATVRDKSLGRRRRVLHGSYKRLRRNGTQKFGQLKCVEGCYMGHTSDYVATEPWMYGKEDPYTVEGCYMGHTSDYVATEPWMYGKEDPCAGPGWRERTARKG
jgi:hypothetical protein